MLLDSYFFGRCVFYQNVCVFTHTCPYVWTPSLICFFSSSANGNESTKYKGDHSPCVPSRVLHVRKVPIEVSEAEVISLGIPFGKVTNLLMLKSKNQVCFHAGVYNLLTKRSRMHVTQPAAVFTLRGWKLLKLIK